MAGLFQESPLYIVRERREKEIYHKEFSHVIMTADHPQHMQSASCKPRRANSVVPVQSLVGLRGRKSQNFSLDPEAGKMVSQLKDSHLGGIPSTFWRVILFVLFRPKLIGWDPPALGRTIHFTQSTNSNVNVWLRVWAPHGANWHPLLDNMASMCISLSHRCNKTPIKISASFGKN